MKSCWIINFQSGKILVSDDDKDRLVYGPINIENKVVSEEHWFDETKAREKNPDAIVVRVAGL